MTLIAAVIVIALGSALQAGTVEPMPDDVVVTAVRDRCVVKFADKEMTESEFDKRAREWASGRPVRVSARANADIKCLSKIAFKLADRGVRRIEFIDPSGASAQPPLAPTTSTSSTGQSDLRDREHNFVAAKAAKLILEGKCADARRMALEAGDLGTAANITVICQQR
ncbi:hypothetical protein GCM10009087_26420 [Sphingomonas oligophenolica]